MQDDKKGKKKSGWSPLPGPSRGQSAARRQTPGSPRRVRLRMPVIGLESEFNVILDGNEIDPRKYWGKPSAFIEGPLLARERSSFHVPTGSAVYFDRGVIEVVTPVIELAPGCTARVVRNLWEGIGFVRDQLTSWQERTDHHVRLRAYSTHYNISFEVPRARQKRERNVRALALLLAYVLPFPVALVATNRRSSGIGVRPRGDRLEVTVDFTPDPGLMIAAASLITGIVREVMSWPSYSLALLDRLPIPTVAGVVPGKHTTRKGWLTKEHHYAQNPFTSDVDAPLWRTRDGRTLSLRVIAREVAWYFRLSIRRWSDPFSFRLLFAVLDGRATSLLDLPDRPAAYDDVGRLCRWGSVLPDRTASGAGRPHAPVVVPAAPVRRPVAARASKGAVPATRAPERSAARAPRAARGARIPPGLMAATAVSPEPAPALLELVSVLAKASPRERRRRVASNGAARPRTPERRAAERRRKQKPAPFPDRRLTRSAYEKVFLKLVSGDRLRIGRGIYTPVGMRGWFHAVFRRDSDGQERLLSIDQLLKKMDKWQ